MTNNDTSDLLPGGGGCRWSDFDIADVFQIDRPS